MIIQHKQSPGAPSRPKYTIGSLVNDEAQYAAMLASFAEHGFGDGDVEFIAVRDARSAFEGLNAVIDHALGAFVILCHQDIRLDSEGRATLERRLGELEDIDPSWALAGNAGGMAPGRLAIRISDPHGSDRRVGALPARVMSLDENFIVLKKGSGLRFSRDLDGFHLYGADICMVADVLGWSAWVIDFHLAHLSPGRKDHTFVAATTRFRKKWSRALRPRWMQTPCALLRLSGSRAGSALGRLFEEPMRVLSRRMPWADGWTSPLPTDRRR